MKINYALLLILALLSGCAISKISKGSRSDRFIQCLVILNENGIKQDILSDLCKSALD
jgi:hypothetical protein